MESEVKGWYYGLHLSGLGCRSTDVPGTEHVLTKTPLHGATWAGTCLVDGGHLLRTQTGHVT